MEFHLRPILTSFLLVVVLAVSHAYSLPSEADWKSALPNTSFTKPVRNLLMHPAEDETSTNAGKAIPTAGMDTIYENPQKATESSTNAGKDASSIAAYDAVDGNPQKVGASSINSYKDASPIVGYDAVYRSPQKLGDGRVFTGYGNPQKAGGSSVEAGEVSPSMEQGHQDHANAANYLFFLGRDLHPGTKMMIDFTKTSSAAHFLPHQVAESIPFSSNKLPEILNRFSVKENSTEAKIIQKTIEQCETPPIVGEVKYCARSFESLIDFSTSRLGKDIQALSNEVEVDTQEYKFGEGAKMVGEKSVVCHQLNYPYAVALCHAFQMTKIYKVPLEGANGTRVKAIAVCHEDTSTWHTNALALQVLKVKQGTSPICHFLPNGHTVWVPK